MKPSSAGPSKGRLITRIDGTASMKGPTFMATRNALTLAELVVVLCLLVALSAVLVPLCSDSLVSAAESVTEASLVQARDATLQYWRDTKYVSLDGVLTVATEAQRFNISWLFNNPVTG